MKKYTSDNKSEKAECGNKILNLIKSFAYAFCGIAYAVKNERNMRIHICAVVLVFEFAFFYKLTSIEYVVLILTVGAVITAEMINTAIESAVDLEASSYNKIAKVAKDTSAGAVLVTAICSVFVALFMFSDTQRLMNVYDVIYNHLWIIAVLAAELIIAVIFVFGKNTTKN